MLQTSMIQEMVLLSTAISRYFLKLTLLLLVR